MPHDWQKINESHGPLVWRVVYRILQSHSESLDCFQDVMLEAFQKSNGKSINNWPGFLRWLAVRRAIDRLRQKLRNKSAIDSTQDVGLVSNRSSKSTSSSLEMKELLARLRSELTKLPQHQAEAFWLRFVEQMSYAEIAEQMNIQSNKVGVLIHRARAQMCAAISDLQPID